MSNHSTTNCAQLQQFDLKNLNKEELKMGSEVPFKKRQIKDGCRNGHDHKDALQQDQFDDRSPRSTIPSVPTVPRTKPQCSVHSIDGPDKCPKCSRKKLTREEREGKLRDLIELKKEQARERNPPLKKKNGKLNKFHMWKPEGEDDYICTDDDSDPEMDEKKDKDGDEDGKDEKRRKPTCAQCQNHPWTRMFTGIGERRKCSAPPTKGHVCPYKPDKKDIGLKEKEIYRHDEDGIFKEQYDADEQLNEYIFEDCEPCETTVTKRVSVKDEQKQKRYLKKDKKEAGGQIRKRKASDAKNGQSYVPRFGSRLASPQSSAESSPQSSAESLSSPGSSRGSDNPLSDRDREKEWDEFQGYLKRKKANVSPPPLCPYCPFYIQKLQQLQLQLNSLGLTFNLYDYPLRLLPGHGHGP